MASSPPATWINGVHAVTPPAIYAFHGVPVFTGTDPIMAPIAGATPNPDSANVIAALETALGTQDTFDYDSTSGEIVNLATNSTATYTVTSRNSYSPPIECGTTVPWQNGFYIEGLIGGGDAHSQVLNTQSGIDNEMYGTAWTSPSGPLTNTYYGSTLNLAATLESQYACAGDTENAGMPLLGFTDYGEDANAVQILHPLSFLVPASAGVLAVLSEYGIVRPATAGYNYGTCSASPGYCIHYGDVWVLDAGFNCSTYSLVAQLICAQLKAYGAVLVDDVGATSNLAFRFGSSSNGANPWNYATNLQPFFAALKIEDGYLVSRSAVICAGGTTWQSNCW